MKCNFRNVLFLAIFFIIVFGCNKKPQKLWTNIFEDEIILKIAELQDRQETDSLIMFLKSKKTPHRERAALAFATLQDTLAIPYLSQIIQTDKYEEPRRAAAWALGQIGHPKAKEALYAALASEISAKNQEYVMEAIGKCAELGDTLFFEKFNSNMPDLYLGWLRGVFQLAQKKIYSNKLITRVIEERNIISDANVKVLSAHYVYRLRNYLITNQLDAIKKWHEVESIPVIKRRLAMIWFQEEKWIKNWDLVLWDSLNAYEKGDYLHVLNDIDFLKMAPSLISDSELHYVVRNTLLELLIEKSNLEQKEVWIDYGLISGDVALQSIAAGAIVKHQIKKPLFVSRCKDLLGSLNLPEKLETHLEIKKAFEWMLGKEMPFKKYTHNRPVNWEEVCQIPQNQKVLIETSLGNIVLECFVNDAPATVWNFLKLVDEGYFDEKNFHRIVPDFVIQGGCPRGDGWGGSDWVQRSEWSHYRRYLEGMVGVASVGRNTENVQFFINSEDSPHLDGRYTIFGKVVEGLDVVREMKKGDIIIQIKKIYK